MDLHQIEFLHTPERARRCHLVDAVIDERRPDLGCAEQSVAPVDPVQAIAHDIFGRAVHWRRIDDGAAGVEKRVQNARAGVARVTERLLQLAVDADDDWGPDVRVTCSTNALEKG